MIFLLFYLLFFYIKYEDFLMEATIEFLNDVCMIELIRSFTISILPFVFLYIFSIFVIYINKVFLGKSMKFLMNTFKKG